MNKLILIGNGFDLAHGLPTSYNDFINDFWNNFHLNYKDSSIKKLVYIKEGYEDLLNFSKIPKNFDDFWNNIVDYSKNFIYRIEEENLILRKDKFGYIIFEFKNEFFKRLNKKISFQKWVDIENEYYRSLKEIVKINYTHLSSDVNFNSKKSRVFKLNSEFDTIKKLLEDYLVNKVDNKYIFNSIDNREDWSKVFEILKPISLSMKESYLSEKLKNLSKEFSFYDDKYEISNYKKTFLDTENANLKYFKSLLVSFNYTQTTSHYKYFINREIGNQVCFENYIHGVLRLKSNKINFGFGDEIDKDYEEIENIGDNEYLKNFKSFQYLDNQKYNELLEYIDSEKFQVYILGHSCGLSDRVLLNTIFEHENCRSIKIYYYQKKDGIDNYTDIVQSVSRHFKDKALMRRKLVNKTLCSPLPQVVRFKKKET